MIQSASENGADAVKLQTFIAQEMISKSMIADDPDNPGSEIPLFEFFQRYELSRSDYEVLFAYAKSLNISFSVKKKIGNAVKRNKIKRRLKNIMNDAIKKISINLNFSFLVIGKLTVLNSEFKDIKKALFQDLKKIK